MKITLHDARTLRLAFPYSVAAKSFVASLVGAEYEGKTMRTWKVPLCHLRTIMERFPTAEVEDQATVIEARYELWRQWIRNHNACGFYFALADDAATVVAYRDDDEPVSDVLQAHVAKRSPQLREWLHVQISPSAPAMPRVHRPTVWDAAKPTDGDRLILTGIQNAAKREEQRAEAVERAKGKRRRAKVEQMSLIGDESSV